MTIVDVQTVVRPRRVLNKQVALYGGPKRTASTKSAYTDSEWFDTLDRFSSSKEAAELSLMLRNSLLSTHLTHVSEGVEDSASSTTSSQDVIHTGDDRGGDDRVRGGDDTAVALYTQGSCESIEEDIGDEKRQSGEVVAMAVRLSSPLVTVPSAAPGPHVPNPPLRMADREMRFVPVPETTGFGGYWVKDLSRCTPPPFPLDILFKCNRIAVTAHESVFAIWIKDGPVRVTMSTRPTITPIGGSPIYKEYFPKDGSTATWKITRPASPLSRSFGQLYFTECGTLIFRVLIRNAWTNRVEAVFEDYMRLENEGHTIVARMCGLNPANGRVVSQFVVGDYRGPNAPAGWR